MLYIACLLQPSVGNRGALATRGAALSVRLPGYRALLATNRQQKGGVYICNKESRALCYEESLQQLRPDEKTRVG